MTTHFVRLDSKVVTITHTHNTLPPYAFTHSNREIRREDREKNLIQLNNIGMFYQFHRCYLPPNLQNPKPEEKFFNKDSNK